MLEKLTSANGIMQECIRAKSESNRFLFFLMLAYANTGLKSDPHVVAEIVRYGMRVDDDMDRNGGTNVADLILTAQRVFHESFDDPCMQEHAIRFLENYAHIENLQQQIPPNEWTAEGIKTYRETAALPWAYVLTAATDYSLPLPPTRGRMQSLEEARNQHLALPSHFETIIQRKQFYASFGLMMQVQVMGDIQGRNWNIEQGNPAFGVGVFGINWKTTCNLLLCDYTDITRIGGKPFTAQMVNLAYPLVAAQQHRLSEWSQST